MTDKKPSRKIMTPCRPKDSFRLHVQRVHAASPAPETPEKTVLTPGDLLADGTVYVGTSPTTHKPLYIMPHDHVVRGIFNDAVDYKNALNSSKKLGHDDWRLPSAAELEIIWMQRGCGKLSGRFNHTTLSISYWYVGTETGNDKATVVTKNFADGRTSRGNRLKERECSIFCVRGA